MPLPEPPNERPQLLEMAAKAAGYDGLRWSMLRQCFYDCSGVYWRPADDDGDALRLAVKLMIEVGRCFQRNPYSVFFKAMRELH